MKITSELSRLCRSMLDCMEILSIETQKCINIYAVRKEEADLIKRISPIAWQNLNLLGRFEFHKQQSVINIDEMIYFLEQKNAWQRPKVT
jgi:hypothetical protein